MPDSIVPREGPFVDEQGRECLGIWADEGGYLLILRRENDFSTSFYIAQNVGTQESHSFPSLTVSSFRYQRIRKFLRPSDGSDNTVENLIDDFTGRNGFDHVWDMMNEEDKEELKQTWQEIVDRGR